MAPGEREVARPLPSRGNGAGVRWWPKVHAMLALHGVEMQKAGTVKCADPKVFQNDTVRLPELNSAANGRMKIAM